MDGASPYILVPYFAAGALLLVFSMLRGWQFHDRGIDRLLALMLILLAAIAASSADLGTDAPGYHSYYEELGHTTELYGWWDPGFVWLGLLFSGVGAPFAAFVFALVLGSHLIKLYVFDKLSTNTVLAFFVLFCFNIGEVAFVRQYLAASIILLTFYLLSRRRIVLAVLSIFAATLIHKTAFPVGVLVILVYYGRAGLKPALLFLIGTALALTLLPAQITQVVQDRAVAQFAAYTVEGYVQGIGDDADTLLARNIGKFFIYMLLAASMLMLAPKNDSERLQRSAGYVVILLSLISVGLIAVSPVFSRYSVYVFPFLALCMRAERFAPNFKQLPAQSAIVALLLANLVISTYPLREYL